MTEAEVIRNLELLMIDIVKPLLGEHELNLLEDQSRLQFLGASVYAKLVAEWRALRRGKGKRGEK